MFGHQDDQPVQNDNAAISDDSIQGALNDNGQDHPADGGQAEPGGAHPGASPSNDDHAWQHPGTPIGNNKEPAADTVSPAGGFPKKPTYQYPVPSSPSDDNSDSGPKPDSSLADTEELIDIKQQALGELSPLVDKLDLPPEEKFRTIMMMIQASDDQTLVKAAHDAAHAIEDDKARAQALLDIINEVNYFTSPRSGQPDQKA